MINLKIIKGIRDYVNQTAASAPKERAPASCVALRYKTGKEARIFVLSDETLRTARQVLRLMDLRPRAPNLFVRDLKSNQQTNPSPRNQSAIKSGICFSFRSNLLSML